MQGSIVKRLTGRYDNGRCIYDGCKFSRGRNERGLPISALLIAECSRVSVSVYWSSRIDRLETIK